MPTPITAAPPSEPVAGIKDGIIGTLGAFGNPPATASRLRLRWFWIYPFLVLTVAIEFNQLMTTAQRAHIAQAMLEARGLTGAQIEAQLAVAAKFAPVGLIVAPLLVLAFMALSAFLIRLVSSVTGTESRFSHFLALTAAGSMPAALQIVAATFLVRLRNIDEIRSSADMQPPFGMNVFIDSAPKMIEALLGFFSIFEIWGIIMCAMIFAAAFKTTLGKAFVATSPLWIVGAFFAMLGSLFG